MTDLIKAADDARRILKGFKAFAEVADALEAAGKIEQRTAEAQRVLAEVLPKIDAAQAAVVEAQAKAASLAAAAHADANRIVDVARAEAEGIVKTAWDEHGRVTSLGQTQKAKYDDAVGKLKAKFDEIVGKRDALEAECNALEQRLAEARAQVSKLLG
jgi:hypothetical protein